jgi:hypothetical protein
MEMRVTHFRPLPASGQIFRGTEIWPCQDVAQVAAPFRPKNYEFRKIQAASCGQRCAARGNSSDIINTAAL